MIFTHYVSKLAEVGDEVEIRDKAGSWYGEVKGKLGADFLIVKTDNQQLFYVERSVCHVLANEAPAPTG